MPCSQGARAAPIRRRYVSHQRGGAHAGCPVPGRVRQPDGGGQDVGHAVDRYLDGIQAATTRAGYAETLARLTAIAGSRDASSLQPDSTWPPGTPPVLVSGSRPARRAMPAPGRLVRARTSPLSWTGRLVPDQSAVPERAAGAASSGRPNRRRATIRQPDGAERDTVRADTVRRTGPAQLALDADACPAAPPGRPLGGRVRRRTEDRAPASDARGATCHGLGTGRSGAVAARQAGASAVTERGADARAIEAAGHHLTR